MQLSTVKGNRVLQLLFYIEYVELVVYPLGKKKQNSVCINVNMWKKTWFYFMCYLNKCSTKV